MADQQGLIQAGQVGQDNEGSCGVERMFWFMAWHLPKRLVYFAAIRLVVHATQGQWSSTEVPKLYAMDALKRWEA